jgi:hypothetical protein
MGLITGTGIDQKFREDWGWPQCRIEEGKIVRWSADNAKPQPSEEEIKVWRDKQDVYSANEVVRIKRGKQYPKIGDQLDDLYKAGAFGDEMTTKIKKVKDDNPKS